MKNKVILTLFILFSANSVVFAEVIDTTGVDTQAYQALSADLKRLGAHERLLSSGSDADVTSADLDFGMRLVSTNCLELSAGGTAFVSNSELCQALREAARKKYLLAVEAARERQLSRSARELMERQMIMRSGASPGLSSQDQKKSD